MNVELFVLAVVATLSPLGFAAMLAVIASGRLKALVFASAFVGGQLLACGVLVFLRAAVAPHQRRDFPTLRGVLELLFGAALLCVAAFVRSRPDATEVASTPGSTALFDRLRRLHVATAAAAGVLLGIGGPKRLVLTALAAISIGASTADGAHAAALVVAYTLLATLLVWAPILAFAILGERVTAALDGTQRWLERHQRSLAFWASLTIGLFAVANGLARLL